ncbi:hypothetical protein F5879DRAFT_744584 [Lentinula edodes]|nr:hypothetical protein F5879DRAFT_744584 [Lentinula edodes]
MPRRTSARSAIAHAALNSSTRSATVPPRSLPENLVVLRKQWKWAAFSQFFFTFSPLFAMDDVSLKDVEDDLYMGSSLVLPRIMVRLLYTLSYDRKVNLNNWQTTLRRQYTKRDPIANPIGPEPIKEDDYARELTSPEPPSTKEGTNEPTDDTVVRSKPSSREHSMFPENGKAPMVKPEDDFTTSTTSREKYHPSKAKDNAPEEESKDWLSLNMLEKLDSLHLLTEWQFQSPKRVRMLMKSDDDQASWRIEPIGYDAKRNAYWLIGADRLWIQRVPPKPPRPPPKHSLKRKRIVDTNQTKTKLSSTKRLRLQNTIESDRNVAKSAVEPVPSSSGRHGRAAKDQANLKLDAQAKELAELNRQAALLASHSPGSNRKSSTRGASSSKLSSSPARPTRGTSSARPLGTRQSARLRGSDDDEWQAIPDEWLQNDEDGDMEEKGKDKRGSPSLRSVSSISELTELSEEEEIPTPAEETRIKEEPVSPDKSQENVSMTQEFVEWETIAVTLFEWEHIAERWQNATHYSEKALCKVLKNHIVPIITEELRDVEVKRQKEESITQRKRSSRIAIRESEKEEVRLAAKKKAEEEEKMSRAKRLEARQRKEEAERIKRETAREQRRKEREEKEEREAREAEEKEKKEQQKAERAAGRAKQRSSQSKPVTQPFGSDSVLLLHPPGGSHYSSIKGSTNNSRNSRTSAGDDWELDCEICNRHGKNLDERVPLLCCALCSRWQHISCHDQADLQAGRPRRNWDQDEFICRRCRMDAHNSNQNGTQMQYPQAMNMYPSLRSSVPSPYNQVPYGQGLGLDSGAPHISNGYIDAPMTNGSRAYGTTDVRSSQTYMDRSNAGPDSKQILFSHYQPQQHGFVRNEHEQRGPQDLLTAYGHSAHSYNHYGNNNSSNEMAEWNETSTNHAYEYSSTSSSTPSISMSHNSIERTSVVPESSSRHISHNKPAYYQQQEEWNSHSSSAERLNAISNSSSHPIPHDLPTHHQQQQQWHSRHPTAASSQMLSQSNMPFATSPSPLQSHPL